MRLHSFFMCLLLMGKCAFAQPNIKTHWHNQWMGSSSPSVPNSFTKYRTHIFLNKIYKTITASIATDSKYWLWINDSLIVFEGQLKRGPTPKDTYYYELNLTPYLKQGHNTIAILDWYFGKDGFCHKSSGKTDLLMDVVDENNTSLLSGLQWKMQPHLAYQNTLPPYPNYRLPEHSIHYDARIDNEHWIAKTYNDELWPAASVLCKAGRSET